MTTKSVEKIIPDPIKLNIAMNRLIPATIELIQKKEKENKENQTA